MNHLGIQPRVWGWGSALLAVALLSACSSGPKRPPPAPLVAHTAQVPARLVWSAQAGAVGGALVPAVAAGQIAVANSAGQVTVWDAPSGREVWRAQVGAPLSAGAGFDGTQAAVVTQANDLVVVRGGQVAWKVRLGARVYTPPLVAGQRVFVTTADRSLSAYDAQSGARLWNVPARQAEPLVLEAPGVLIAVNDTLVAGLSGRLTGYNPLNGAVRWEVPLATARGVNDIERLVDLVAKVGRLGDTVCARAFQSAVGCIDANRGTPRWSRSASGTVGVDADPDRVYGAEGNGVVRAWRTDNGDPLWSTERLLNRGLTAPLAAGRSIVLGDAMGYVHLLAREDGSVLNRLSTDGSAIVTAPALSGSTLLALTRNGGVYAWRPE